ncbi:MAG: SdrD B-like domain-containing protein, partial [Halobacteriales archaeon]|nr:SdrD B-like domain-containing protein [Halobacteriales archaeon]
SSDLTIDFGFMDMECDGRIGDFIWNDTGGTKGIQDPGEPGLEGIRVVLREGGPSGPVIAETTTDADGFYEFTGLCGGDYTVTVDESTLPPDFMQTQELVGDDTTIDNNPNPFTFTLPADDAEDLTVDFGFMEMCEGEIGDRVWNDRFPEKGIQNPEEEGLAGIRVILKDAQGNQLAETTTDADGNYLFTGLCDGDYIVEVDESTLPFGFEQTPTGVGSDPTIDGNPNPAGVNLPTNSSSDLTIDFGYMQMRCQECEGKVRELTLRFLGPDGSFVTVEADGVIFQGTLDNGELFTLRGSKSDGEFEKNDLIFTVNGVEVGALHVSCSDLIGPGTTDLSQEKGRNKVNDGKADFEVVEAFSKDGGEICPAPPPPPGGFCQECDGGVSEATFE